MRETHRYLLLIVILYYPYTLNISKTIILAEFVSNKFDLNQIEYQQILSMDATITNVS